METDAELKQIQIDKCIQRTIEHNILFRTKTEQRI